MKWTDPTSKGGPGPSSAFSTKALTWAARLRPPQDSRLPTPGTGHEESNRRCHREPQAATPPWRWDRPPGAAHQPARARAGRPGALDAALPWPRGE